MKAALFLAIMALVIQSAGAEDITFTNRTATFSDLQGRSYRRVQLVRGDRDGLIWRDGASGGRICYTNLDPDLLESFGISSNRIEIAKARAEKKAVADARYRAQALNAQAKILIQAQPTNTVPSTPPSNGYAFADRPSPAYGPDYPYPAFFYGFGAPTVAPSAPSAMPSASAPTALNVVSAANSAHSQNAGPAPNVAIMPHATAAASAPSAAPASSSLSVPRRGH